MIFNDCMTIWIVAVLLMAAVSLAGWRQGAIRAAFSFVGIFFAALLAAPLGRLFHPLLPHVGASNPVLAWALAPVVGFIVASIPFKVAAQYVHHRVEHFYKYNAGELRLALWQRLNIRLGICIGLLNGAVYFVLVSFFIFNLAYWTSQTTKDPAGYSDQALPVRLASNLGEGLQATGFAKTASAVGTLSPTYYKLADLSGLLMQNPQVAPRVADYPGLVSLWHDDRLRYQLSDVNLTNALAAGTSFGQIFSLSSVQSLLADKTMRKVVEDAVLTNLDDFVAYLQTGKSAKYGGEPILGKWRFNAGVTLAWLREEQPKMGAKEMGAIRALWTQAYADTLLLMTGDNQLYITGFPKFVPPQPNQPSFQAEDWKGDWSRDGANYSLHMTLNGQDKYLTATTDGLRLRVKDGRSLLIFDHVD
jgi:hypothetical protein